MTPSQSLDRSRQRTAIIRSVVRRSLRGMTQSVPVQLLAITSIAVSMVLLGVAMLAWTNTRSVVHGWGGEVPVTVYLQDQVESSQIEDLQARVAQISFVERVERIGPEDALGRLAAGLGSDATVLEGLDASLFPTSLEVHWRSDASPSSQSALVTQLRRTAEVEDVVAAGDWAQAAEDFLDTLRDVVLSLAALVALSCLAIVRATIRLGVLSRRSEIEILGLVGGTRAYITAPFMIEGLIQGIVGTGLAVALLWGGFSLARPTLDAGLGLVLAGGSVRFLSPVEVIGGLILGGLVGVIGSRAAVARHVEP